MPSKFLLYDLPVGKLNILNDCYAILCPKSTGSRIQTYKLLSVMTMCRNAYNTGTMAHTYYEPMKVLFTEFLWHA